VKYILYRPDAYAAAEPTASKQTVNINVALHIFLKILSNMKKE